MHFGKIDIHNLFYNGGLHETTFFVEKRDQVNAFIKQLEDVSKVGAMKEMNEHIKKKIGDLFTTPLNFPDTKKDRHLIKGLFATATSTTFVAKLLNVRNKSAIKASKNELGKRKFTTVSRYRNNI